MASELILYDDRGSYKISYLLCFFGLSNYLNPWERKSDFGEFDQRRSQYPPPISLKFVSHMPWKPGFQPCRIRCLNEVLDSNFHGTISFVVLAFRFPLRISPSRSSCGPLVLPLCEVNKLSPRHGAAMPPSNFISFSQCIW